MKSGKIAEIFRRVEQSERTTRNDLEDAPLLKQRWL